MDIQMLKNKNDTSVISVKTLFDHLKAITTGKDDQYFNKLDQASQKTWSNFMITKYLSMNIDFIETVNELQQYTINLPPNILFKLYAEIIPKGNVFLKYIKGKNDVNNIKLIKLIAKHFSISEKESSDYIDIFNKTENGIASLKSIVEKYGYNGNEIIKMMKKQ